MATSRKRNVEIDFIVDDSQKSKLKGIGDEATKSGKGFSNLSGNMKLAVAAGAALVATKLVDFLGDSARAAAEDDKSQRLLALALKNTTGATKDQVAGVEAWIDGMSRASGVADDELRPALANLVRASGDVDQSQKDLGVAMDAAAAKGLDLETVTKAMARANLGNTGALGKLGIATKDAEGNALSYEQILAEITRTMGGSASEAAASLSGQLARQQVAWEETKETIGAQVIPAVVTVAGAFSTLFADAFGSDTEASIAKMQFQFNDLVNQGLDPASDATAAFISILAESESSAAATKESVESLKGMVGLTTDQYGVASQYIKDNADALGLNATEVENITRLLDTEYITVVADAKAILSGHTEAIEDNIDATREQIDANRELVDPLFAVIAATDRAKTAEKNYNEQVKLHGDYSEEALEASVGLAGATLDVEAAAARYAEEGGPASVAVFRDLLEQAGLSEVAIQKIIDRVLLLNATPAKNPITFNPRTGAPELAPVKGVFHAGGVIPGHPGDDVTVAAKAGETISPRSGGGGMTINVYGSLIHERELLEIIRRQNRSLL